MFKDTIHIQYVFTSSASQMLIQYASGVEGAEMNGFSQTASDYLGRCNASLEIQFCSLLGARSSSEKHGGK